MKAKATPKQKAILAQLAASETGAIMLPFSAANTARNMFAKGLVHYTICRRVFIGVSQDAANKLERRDAVACGRASAEVL